MNLSLSGPDFPLSPSSDAMPPSPGPSTDPYTSDHTSTDFARHASGLLTGPRIDLAQMPTGSFQATPQPSTSHTDLIPLPEHSFPTETAHSMSETHVPELTWQPFTALDEQRPTSNLISFLLNPPSYLPFPSLMPLPLNLHTILVL